MIGNSLTTFLSSNVTQNLMSETTPKISVIVPVYKAEAYLHRCVDSLLAQTFQDFEILLIDDGSPDRSGEICDEYARKDKRVRVFHKENGGVSAARNEGIIQAKGEWIAFIDSDDYIDRTYIEDFGLDRYDADIYLQGYQVEMNGKVLRRHYFSVNGILFVPFVKMFVEGEIRNILNSPCCKLFRRRIVTMFDLSFDTSISFGEDHLFVLSYLCCAQTFVLSPVMGYHYVHYAGESLTRKVIPLDKILYYAKKSYQLQMKLICAYDTGDKRFLTAIHWRTYSNMLITLRNLFLSDMFCLQNFRVVRNTYRMLGLGFRGLSFCRKCLQLAFAYLPIRLSYNLFILYTYIR